MVKNDTYYFHQTPIELCRLLIQQIPITDADILYEPFKGEGNFYNNFPEKNLKYSTEIEEGTDFRDFDKEFDWVISNPPFRLEDNTGKRENAYFTILDYFSTRVRKGIAFLANDNCFSTLNPRRLQLLNNRGLYLQNIIVCNVKKWRGRYFFLIFGKNPNTFYKFIEGSY